MRGVRRHALAAHVARSIRERLLVSDRARRVREEAGAARGSPDAEDDAGLSLRLKISNYTSNRETKDFLRRSARKKHPGVTEKSGVWYRRNRWREAEVARRRVTYGELVDQYIALN